MVLAILSSVTKLPVLN